MKKRVNKTTEIIRYMRSHAYITDRIAREKFGATRLAAIICRLRKRGYLITTEICYEKDRYGNTCSYAKYRLVKAA